MREGYSVIISGLSYDSSHRPFGQILSLIPFASHLEWKSSLCRVCREKGKRSPTFLTARSSDSTDQKLVGGDDLYYPLCSACLLKQKVLTQ